MATTDEGGGSDGDRERRKSDVTVTGGAAQKGFTFAFVFAWLQWRRWPKVVGDSNGRGCNGEREERVVEARARRRGFVKLKP